MLLKFLSKDLKLISEKTSVLWQGKKNKTIFITGGTGFFGIWLLMSFIHINKQFNLNNKLIILTRNRNFFLIKHPWLSNYPDIKFIEGNIVDFKFFPDDVHYVIHAATEASVKLNNDNPLEMFDTIVNGTKRVLEFSKIKKVESFLLTSSGAVYGKQPSNINNIGEDYYGAPDIQKIESVYAEGKRISETLCTVYFEKYGLPVKIARCFAFVGPFLKLDSHFAIGNFIGDLLNNKDILINGDGTPLRSYMYSSDLCIWLWTILFKGHNNSPYNVGSDKSISISELAKIILKNSDLNKQKIIVKSPISNSTKLKYVPKIDKAINDLGLEIYNDLEESILKTINFNVKYLKLKQ
jgi:nucleoside-diphosphate-sugar epimerase